MSRTCQERLFSPDRFNDETNAAQQAVQADTDGKNVGADVDLVGPGPAYERWKKTPEYQQWLKDSGQVKK